MIVVIALIAMASSQGQTRPQEPFNTFPFGGEWRLGKSERVILFALNLRPMDSSREEVSRCTRACKGNVHLLHAKCDRSCDDACQTKHELTIKPVFVPSDVTDKDFVDFGSAPYEAKPDGVMRPPVGAKRMQGLDQMLRDHIEEQMANSLDLKAHEYAWKTGHWNDAPCSSSAATIEMKNYRLVMRWYVSDTKRTPVPGTNYMTGFHSESEEFDAGILRIPVRKVAFEDPKVACRCEIIKTGKPVKEVGGLILRAPTGEHHATAKQEQEYAIRLVCQDMNTLLLTATSNGGDAMSVAALPGTILVSSDPAYQDEMIVEGPEVLLLEAIFGRSPGVVWGEASGRIVCLNMAKKQPHPGIRYRAALCSDATLSYLANNPVSGAYRTITQQVRAWIYKDRASHAEITERLIPPPSAALYVGCLYDVETTGRARLDQKEFGKCFDAKLLAAGGPPDAMAWFARRIAEWKPGEVASWLKSRPAELAAIFAPARAGEGAVLVRALLISAKPEIVRAMLTYLAKELPAGGRAAFVAAGGTLSVGRVLLSSKDAALIALVLDVLEACADPRSAVFLATFASNEKLGTPESRARADALVTRLEG